VKLITLKGGLTTQVDDADYGALVNHRWSLAGSNKPYARARAGYMHRLLTGAKLGEYVDHIDGNSLNNQRANLRLATQSQNHANRKARLAESGYKGVKRRGAQWSARVGLKSGEVHLGVFATAGDAAAAYDAKMRELFGEFADTNFQDTRPVPLTHKELVAQRPCPVCGAPLGLQSGGGRTRKYCSRSCLGKARIR